jgi:hypothetical protein
VSAPLILSCLWVLASALTAMLPMRLQYVPGIALLIAAPMLLVWLGLTLGAWIALAGALAVVSMFRNPLIYLTRRALDKPAHKP